MINLFEHSSSKIGWYVVAPQDTDYYVSCCSNKREYYYANYDHIKGVLKDTVGCDSSYLVFIILATKLATLLYE